MPMIDDRYVDAAANVFMHQISYQEPSSPVKQNYMRILDKCHVNLTYIFGNKQNQPF